MNAIAFSKLIKWCVCACGVVIFTLVVVATYQYIKISTLNKRKESLETRLEKIYSEETTFEDAIEKRSSFSFAEQYAREELGMLEDGDLKYDIK